MSKRPHRQDVLVRAAHLVVGLEAQTDFEHGLDLLPVEVAQGDEVASLEVPCDHFCLSFRQFPDLSAVCELSWAFGQRRPAGRIGNRLSPAEPAPIDRELPIVSTDRSPRASMPLSHGRVYRHGRARSSCGRRPSSVRPVVGRAGLRCRELGRDPRRTLLWGKHTEVGVVPERDAPFVLQPDQPRRTRRHPLRDVGQREASSACLGPDHREGELQRGDAAPGRAEVTVADGLEFRRAGGVVRDDEVDEVGSETTPEQLAVGGLADRGAALEVSGAVVDLLGAQG